VLIFDDLFAQLLEAIKINLPEVDNTDLVSDKSGHADYSFRTFRLSRLMKTSQEDLFSIIKEALKSVGFVSNVALSSGYVNISILDSFFLESVSKYLSERGQYPDTFQDPERVLIEHTSTNPTGPIHIGRSRNSVIGDGIARIFKRCGYRTTTQYYVNDSGKQVAALYKGFQMYHEKDDPTLGNLLDGYQKIYKTMTDREKEKELVEPEIKRYESGDAEILQKIREYCSIVLQSIVESLQKIGIKIDDYVWESSFLRGGELDSVFESLSDKIEDDSGAKFVSMPDGYKIYLRRSNGTSLYFARDIAYHLFKALNADWIIDILGEDHKDHAKNLSYVLKEFMGYTPRLDFVTYGFMSLEGSKFSTRMGNIVSLDEFVSRATEEGLKVVREKRPDLSESRLHEIAEAVAVSSIRFSIVKVNASKQLDFRWKDALSFEGDSAPYVMYAYARSRSILSRIESVPAGDKSWTMNEWERRLARTLFSYPYHLRDALDSLRPEIIANYCLELVKSFNDFYSQCPVIGSGEETEKRVMLVKNFSEILKDAGSLIGIKFLKEM
jgi:arginyl-tRNA synthetase